MYCDSMISVGKAENGFLIEVRVPYKREVKEEDKSCGCCCSPSGHGSKEKTLIAKDEAEVGSVIAKLLPMLTDPEPKPEDEFEEAFMAAMSDQPMKKEMEDE